MRVTCEPSAPPPSSTTAGTHRLNVAPLDESLARLSGLEVDGAQRSHECRQRLHRRTDDDLLAVTNSPFETTCAVRRPSKTGLDLVVRPRSALSCKREPVADLDTLDR